MYLFTQQYFSNLPYVVLHRLKKYYYALFNTLKYSTFKLGYDFDSLLFLQRSGIQFAGPSFHLHCPGLPSD